MNSYKEIVIICNTPPVPKRRKTYTVNIIRDGIHYFYNSISVHDMKQLVKNPDGIIDYVYDDVSGEFIDI